MQTPHFCNYPLLASPVQILQAVPYSYAQSMHFYVYFVPPRIYATSCFKSSTELTTVTPGHLNVLHLTGVRTSPVQVRSGNSSTLKLISIDAPATARKRRCCLSRS